MKIYVHTIDGKLAQYDPGEQITYARRKVTRIAISIEQIRKERQASLAWRRRKFGVDKRDIGVYGYHIIETSPT